MAVTIDDVINETKDFLTEGFQKHGRVRPTVYLFTSDSRLFPLPPTRGMGMMEAERRVAAFRRFCNLVQAEALLHFYLARVGKTEDLEANADGTAAANPHDRECLVLEIETRDEHYCFVWPVMRRASGIVSLGPEEIHRGTIATWPQRQEILRGVDRMHGVNKEDIEAAKAFLLAGSEELPEDAPGVDSQKRAEAESPE